MSSNYVGVNSFVPNLSLMTDGDSPVASVFRLPLERLLDNSVHLDARADALEASNAVSNVSALTPSGSSALLATRTLAANEPVAGTCYRYSAEIRVDRGATATACNITLAFRVGGVDRLFVTAALNTTNGYFGAIRIDGEFTVCGAPSASAAVVTSGVGHETAVASTPSVLLPSPSLAFTANTTAPLVIDIQARVSTVVAGVSFTPVAAYIERVKA